MLKLKLQYFGHLMRRADSLEETDAGWDWGHEEKGTTEDEMAGWHDRLSGHELGQTLGDGEGQGGLQFMGLQRFGRDLATEQQHKHSMHIPFQISVFVFFQIYISKRGIAELYGSCILSFLINLYTVLPGGYINLHSHQ